MAEWQYLRQLHLSGNVLVAGSYKEILYGIDVASGKVCGTSMPATSSTRIMSLLASITWSPTGWLYAIDARNGAILWRHRTTDYRGGEHNWGALMAELVTQNGRLYALDLKNVLHVLDTARGEEISRHTLPEPVRPFVLPLAENALLFGTMDGALLLASL